MGGNLNKIWGLPVKRISSDEYTELGEKLCLAVRAYAPDRRFRPLRHFAEKQDHGDFDGLLETQAGDSYNWVEFLSELSGVKAHKNGATISVPINGFQCDFNLSPTESYECSYDYHSWEAGMLIGIVARRMSLQYASAGLFLMLPLSYFDDNLPNHESKNILITVDTEEIFGILGFDYERFTKGFKHRQELYEWVAQSKHFAANYFEYTELNHQNKTRNRKRPTYAAFLEWAADKPNREGPPSKETVRERFAQLPKIKNEIGIIKAALLKNIERRAKFNGNMVAERQNIAGEALGSFIVAFKESRGGPFVEWLDAHSAEEVGRAIQEFSLTRFKNRINCVKRK